MRTIKKMKKNDAPPSPHYTSIYLDDESRNKIDAIAEETGQSRSQVMRSLIQGTDGTRDIRAAELVAELADLFVLR